MSYVKWEDVTYCDIEIFRDNEKVPALFQDLWITRLSTLRVVFTNHFGGGINPKCEVKIDGITYDIRGNVLETYLRYSGKPTEITCIADYGSFRITKSTTIEVRWIYEAPKLAPAVKNATDIVCGRCLEDGTLNPQGENLYLNAIRVYSSVTALDGTDQRNFCRMRLRWKAGSGEYSGWVTVLDDNASGDEVKEIVPGISLSKRNAYTVQVGVVDSTGAEHTLTRQIPATADTPLHLGRGGKNIGLGGFCDYSHSEAIDVFWDAWFHKGLEALGDAAFLGNVRISGDMTLNGRLNMDIQEVFCCQSTNDAGWINGQTLKNAFPDADGSLLDLGRLFMAVIRREVQVSAGSTSMTYSRTYNVLCARDGDRISGSMVGYFQYNPSNVPISLSITGTDHKLEAYAGSDAPVAFTNSGNTRHSVRALYVLL